MEKSTPVEYIWLPNAFIAILHSSESCRYKSSREKKDAFLLHILKYVLSAIQILYRECL
jgi:hypothetical protein